MDRTCSSACSAAYTLFLVYFPHGNIKTLERFIKLVVLGNSLFLERNCRFEKLFYYLVVCSIKLDVYNIKALGYERYVVKRFYLFLQDNKLFCDLMSRILFSQILLLFHSYLLKGRDK